MMSDRNDGLFELWQVIDDSLARMQAVATGDNRFIQEIETIKKKLADSVTEVMESPEWNYIPARGEVFPDPRLNEVNS